MPMPAQISDGDWIRSSKLNRRKLAPQEVV